jgi:N-acetylglutamate synthase-like GNAT family acetyltransferase
MLADSIHFRKASEVDLDSIWDLLHANGIGLKNEEILQLIDRIYILEYQKRIMGVLCGNYSEGRVNILWTAIHPIYPEHSLREAMIQQFTAIICRIPGDGIKMSPGLNSFVQGFRKRPLLLFLKTEGATHGVQD